MGTPLKQRGLRRARKAGLQYVRDLSTGWRRRRCGRGFVYLDGRGRRLTGQRTLQRIASLAIPPAWEDVRICPNPHGHLQATGRDAKGRQQYLYHADWHAISAQRKFDRLDLVGRLLPRVRRRVRRDLGRKSLKKEKVVAAIVRLIDKAHLRVGSAAYADDNDSHGATTLKPGHVELDELSISLDFPGKGGKQTEVLLSDAKVAAVIRQCEEIAGQFLFCYRDADGEACAVSSSDVNSYLRSVAGEDLTAKDFRTWSGSVLALGYLKKQLEATGGQVTRRALLHAIERTARELGHTRTVCRQSYIHPGLLSGFETGRLSALLQKFADDELAVPAELTRDEALLLAILPALSTRSSKGNGAPGET
jgi:DNA topoisomerase I